MTYSEVTFEVVVFVKFLRIVPLGVSISLLCWKKLPLKLIFGTSESTLVDERTSLCICELFLSLIESYLSLYDSISFTILEFENLTLGEGTDDYNYSLNFSNLMAWVPIVSLSL